MNRSLKRFLCHELGMVAFIFGGIIVSYLIGVVAYLAIVAMIVGFHFAVGRFKS